MMEKGGKWDKGGKREEGGRGEGGRGEGGRNEDQMLRYLSATCNSDLLISPLSAHWLQL